MSKQTYRIYSTSLVEATDLMDAINRAGEGRLVRLEAEYWYEDGRSVPLPYDEPEPATEPLETETGTTRNRTEPVADLPFEHEETPAEELVRVADEAGRQVMDEDWDLGDEEEEEAPPAEAEDDLLEKRQRFAEQVSKLTAKELKEMCARAGIHLAPGTGSGHGGRVLAADRQNALVEHFALAMGRQSPQIASQERQDAPRRTPATGPSQSPAPPEGLDCDAELLAGNVRPEIIAGASYEALVEAASIDTLSEAELDRLVDEMDKRDGVTQEAEDVEVAVAERLFDDEGEPEEEAPKEEAPERVMIGALVRDILDPDEPVYIVEGIDRKLGKVELAPRSSNRGKKAQVAIDKLEWSTKLGMWVGGVRGAPAPTPPRPPSTKKDDGVPVHLRDRPLTQRTCLTCFEDYNEEGACPECGDMAPWAS